MVIASNDKVFSEQRGLTISKLQLRLLYICSNLIFQWKAYTSNVK